MNAMHKSERLQTILSGGQPDRPAVSFWRHFFREENSAAGLARVTLDFQKRYDWDLVKVNPRADYFGEVWGSTFTTYDDDHKKPTLASSVIRSPDDWAELSVKAPDEGVLGEHLDALRLIREGLADEAPFVMTVFTPLSIAARVAGADDVLREHLNAAPEAVEAGLRTITETFQGFVTACLDAGCCGLYYATTTWGVRTRLSWPEYERFGRPYDQAILGVLDDRAWLNILHVCGADCYLSELLDYPVQALSWDMTDQTTPDVDEIARRTDKTLVGGITQVAVSDDANRRGLVTEARMACDMTGGRRWILGAGCCLPTTVTDGNLRALREWVDGSAGR